MYKRSVGGWAKHLDFILLDTLCLQISFMFAFFIRFNAITVYSVNSAYRTSGIVLFFLGVVVAILFNTMHNVMRRNIMEEIKYTIEQCGLVFAAIVVLLFTSKDSDHVSRIVLYITLGNYTVLSFVTRLVYKSILSKVKSAGSNHEILLVGDRVGIEKALTAFSEHPEAGINVRGLVFVERSNGFRIGEKFENKPIVANIGNASDFIRNEWIDEVYIACYDYSLIPNSLIMLCEEMAVTVHWQIFPFEKVKGKQWFERIAKQPVLTTSINIPKPQSLMIKRLVDILAGCVLSVASLVLLFIVTPMIKLSSSGPVLLKLDRIGLNGKRFKMYMIRTMYLDADKRYQEWKEFSKGEKLTISSDPRFIGNERGRTGIGAWLRSLHFDELPKGFNILLGQMSLVGTRAPSPDEWQTYEYRHRARLSCKPGLTGLWQASGRSKTMSFEEATSIDTEYIANWSLGLDWKILFMTIGVENRQKQRVKLEE